MYIYCLHKVSVRGPFGVVWDIGNAGESPVSQRV